MMQTLLATKLHYPKMRQDLVARPRLTQALAPETLLSLTLVCAPAGYGVTTLVATALAEKAREKGVAWLSLDEDDNDPVRFWVYVIAAIRTATAGVGDQALALLQSPQPSPHPAILTFLINDLVAQPSPLILVLDDYHLISSPKIHDQLAFFVEHLPSQLRLIITSRVDPPLPLSRLRARGRLHELRVSDLRFSTEEAAVFLREVMGLQLTNEEILTLEARTEGWIAGLQLAGLSMRGVDDLPAFIGAFSGSHRHLVDYLTEEVLDRQPSFVRQFLLQTAEFDRFCAPLCEAILDFSACIEVGDLQNAATNPQAQTLLEQMERSNLFLVPLDEERFWYRYHHLFADLLRFRARQVLEPAGLREIHRQAALWFEARELWSEAVQHAVSAGAYEIAGRVVADQATSLITQGKVASLTEWLAALPVEKINIDPRLKLAQAWVSLFTGQSLPTMESQVQEALDLIQKIRTSGKVEIPDKEALLGEALAIRATLAMVRNDPQQNIVDSEKALALLPNDLLSLRSLIAWHLAFCYRSCGEVERSIQAYHQAIALSEQSSNVLINLSARRELAEVSLGQGDLHLALAILTRLVEEATNERQTHLYPVSGAYIHLGEIHYELNLLETAAGFAQIGVALPNADFMSFDAYGYALLGRIYAAQGNFSAAYAAIQEAQKLIVQSKHPQRRALTLAQISRFWLKQGEIARAASWLPDGRDVAKDPRHEVFIRQQISHARYLLSSRDKSGAKEIVHELLPPAQAGGRVRDSVELQLLKAQLLDENEAITAVQKALVIAEPAGLVRTFIDEGPAIAGLLARLLDKAESPNVYQHQLLSVFALEEGRTVIQPLVEPLSQRELEVLRLVAQGYSNQEIARELIFTVATAKKHMEHILGKLGVRNRTEAVARARELNLF